MTRRRRIYAGIIITVAAALLLWGVWEWTSWWVGRGSPTWESHIAVGPDPGIDGLLPIPCDATSEEVNRVVRHNQSLQNQRWQDYVFGNGDTFSDGFLELVECFDREALARGPKLVISDPDLDRPAEGWCPPDSRLCFRLPAKEGKPEAIYAPTMTPRYHKTVHLDPETHHDDKWDVHVRTADGGVIRYFVDLSKRTVESLLDDGDEVIGGAPPTRLMGGGAKIPTPMPE